MMTILIALSLHLVAAPPPKDDAPSRAAVEYPATAKALAQTEPDPIDGSPTTDDGKGRAHGLA